MRVLVPGLVAAFSATAVGEMLVVSPTACPRELPSEACFLTNGAADDLSGVSLPRDVTVEYVRELLQEAIKVEHGTIPLYLTTLYSINDQASFEAETLRSVVMEEMLHMVAAGNTLNAIGGHPFLDHPDFVPEYPLVLPLINITASITWFTRTSVNHYQILESIPPSGYNSSISAAYLHIVNTLTALCEQHGEDNIFTGDPAFQVTASLPSGQSANPVLSLANAKMALLGVADQGGGCPVSGKPWPEYSNISGGILGGNYSHSARYTEVLFGRHYSLDDTEGKPTGPRVFINWTDARRFTPNPSVSDFLPDQCTSGGSWIVRNDSFFVRDLLHQNNDDLANYTTDTWQECAAKCMNWTIARDKPLDPCAMWSWQNDSSTSSALIPYHMCLLGQQWTLPSTEFHEGIFSGCQYGTVCNNSLPNYDANGNLSRVPVSSAPPAPIPLQKACAALHQQGLDFASNYTAMLVSLHNVFNGQPETLGTTLMQMYQLKTMAQALMDTPDPRLPSNLLGIGPPWQYIANVSEYERRGGRAFPLGPV